MTGWDVMGLARSGLIRQGRHGVSASGKLGCGRIHPGRAR
jgi:hypothetical protein